MSFRLNDHLVEPSLNRVTTPDGETVQVEPKIMDVLAALADRPNEVVTRDELMQRVWKGVFVTDDVLHRAIRELRRLFDDDAEAPRVIETIRKRGYRLIARIERVERAAGTAVPDNGRPVETLRQTPLAPPFRAAVAANLGLVLIAALAIGAVARLATTRGGDLAAEPRVRFVPLTSDQGNEVDPALSASGRLAYVARGSDGRAHIFTKSAPDANAVQITNGDAREIAPAWSPDESRIAFVRRSGDRCAIWIAAADGREPRELTPCRATSEFKMSWSPDATLLAVAAGGTTLRSPSHIETISTLDGHSRIATDPPAGVPGDWAPSFSPDGRSIAFIRSISGSVGDVWAVTIDGRGVERLTFDNADVLGFDWEPDGRRIVFSSDRAGGISLWRIASAPGAGTTAAPPYPELLAGGGAKLKYPSVARRSGLIAYEDWQYEINLREQPTDAGGEQSAVAISPTADRWNVHPTISPDGTRLAFQSTRSGQYELWLGDRDGGNVRPITRSARYRSPARWSPDGRYLAFTAVSDAFQGTDLLVLDTMSGSTTRIAGAAVAPSWSHDGKRLYFSTNDRGDGWTIVSVSADGTDRRRVTPDGGYAAIESPDGRWLYVAHLDRPGLWRRPIEGGDETLVADGVQADQWPNWGTYDRGIYLLRWPDDGDPCIAVVENGSTTPRLLARLPDYAWPGIAVSRDGSRVIYAHADRRAANIGGLTAR